MGLCELPQYGGESYQSKYRCPQQYGNLQKEAIRSVIRKWVITTRWWWWCTWPVQRSTPPIPVHLHSIIEYDDNGDSRMDESTHTAVLVYSMETYPKKKTTTKAESGTHTINTSRNLHWWYQGGVALFSLSRPESAASRVAFLTCRCSWNLIGRSAMV